MNTTDNGPKTLQEAIKFYADYSNAHNFMMSIRWPDGQVCCPKCGSTRVRYIQTRRQWECREQHPLRRFSLKTGTIMEDSPLPLEKWLSALWLEVNCKNSISSWEIHRALGVTQKTAWFMLHRLRYALQTGSFAPMGGAASDGVEADETFIGGLGKFMHKDKRAKLTGRGAADKTVVMGVLDRNVTAIENGKKKIKRHSKAIASVIRKVESKELFPVIYKHVEKGSAIYTDAHTAYRRLAPDYVHGFVDHALAYVDGKIHTNGLENFWSLFKRCIKGTHVSIEPFHLQAYLDSELFRFNNRDLKDGGRFQTAAPGMVGKRLMYKALIRASEGDTTAANI